MHLFPFIHISAYTLLEQQYKKLEQERDLYREWWAADRGKSLRAPATIAERAEQQAEQVETERERLRGMKAHWSQDDHKLFLEWAQHQATNSANAESEWFEKHGGLPPVVVFTAE